jgi:hypothetical protein
MVVSRMFRAVLIGLLGLAFAPALAQAQGAPCTKTWNGSVTATASWNASGNWLPDGVPGPTDVVCITGTSTVATQVDTILTVVAVHSTRPVQIIDGQLTLADPAETSTFSQLRIAGQVHGPGNISVQKLIGERGNMDGPGTTTVTTRFEVAGFIDFGAERQLITEGTTSLDGFIYGKGRVTWTNRGAVTMLSGDIWGAEFDGKTPVFHNEPGASVTKVGGIYESWLTFALDNDGVIMRPDDPQVGRLWVTTDSGSSTGHFEGIWLNGDQTPFQLGQGATLKKTLIFGFLRLPEGGTLEITDSILIGRGITGRATLILKGHTEARSGQICGGGTTLIVPADATLEWTGTYGVQCKRIETAGTVVITGTGARVADAWGQRMVWANTGTIELVAGYFPVNPGDESARLINRGRIVKTGESAFEFRPRLVNDGVIDIQAGRLTATRLEQTPDSTLRFGLTSDTAYGALTVTELRHGGRLEAAPVGTFVPAANTRFNVITSSNRSGAFASTALSGLRLDESLAATIGLVAPAAAPEPTTGKASAAAPAAVPVAPLAAVDRRIRLAGGRTFVLRPGKGARVRVLSHSRALSARVSSTGTLHVRRARSARGTLKLRYRLVAADGRRSRIATIRITSRW